MSNLETTIMNSILRVARNFRLKSDMCQLGEYDLTFLQMHVLFHLQHQSGLSTTEIARHFQIKLPTAMRLLDQLSKLSLIEKQEDQQDRRVTRYYLTPAGESLFHHCQARRSEYILQALSILDESEKQQLHQIMTKIATRLEKENV